MLGSLPFIVFTNGLPEFNGGTCTMFADDVKLLSDTCDVRNVQADLDCFWSWAMVSVLHFNSALCQLIHVSTSQASQLFLTAHSKLQKPFKECQ